MQHKLLSRQQLLLQIMLQSKKQSPLLVAIDGYAGAGKSTLARWLASQLGQQAAQVITLDDFYCPLTLQQQHDLSGLEALQAYFKVDEFVKDVAAPLQNNNPAIWQPVDWLSASLLPTKSIEPHGVIFIEGVFACHQQLLDYVHLSIMVVADELLRRQRVVERPQPDTDWYRHWLATEDWYHKSNLTEDRVSYLYSGAE